MTYSGTEPFPSFDVPAGDKGTVGPAFTRIGEFPVIRAPEFPDPNDWGSVLDTNSDVEPRDDEFGEEEPADEEDDDDTEDPDDDDFHLDELEDQD